MHEVSVGGALRDYLTGEELQNTTYEEIRQGLAKFLVEEKGYPKERVRSKVPLEYCIDGVAYERALDFVVYNEKGSPVLVVLFCSGNVGTYEKETRCAALLVAGGPAPFAVATDSMEAILLDVEESRRIRQGMSAFPVWEELLKLAGESVPAPMDSDMREKITRIFHAYSGFLFGACCKGACPTAGPKK